MPDGERPDDSQPRSDPTALTTDALQREVLALRELLETKLQVVEAKMVGFREIQIERTQAVDKHFEHLDTVRGEDKREARSLVDLALAAQKEASSTALTAANLAIDKAEIATGKRYDTLAVALEGMRVMLASMMPRKESEARHTAHEAAVSALISRLTAIEATRAGGKETLAGVYALAGFIVSLIVIAGVLAAAGAFNK